MKFCGELQLFETAECKLGWWSSPAVSSAEEASAAYKCVNVFIKYFTKMHTLNLFSEFLKSKWRALKKHLKLVDCMKLAAYTLFHE